MRTIVYVDGFNLYYGCLRGAKCPHKWLDLGKLLSLLLPGDQIDAIKYFTARVTPRAGNPDIALRQQIYFRALETLPNFSIYYGHFLTNKTRMALVSPEAGGPTTAEVWKTEERGQT